jgi:hypothetical protein
MSFIKINHDFCYGRSSFASHVIINFNNEILDELLKIKVSYACWNALYTRFML